MAEAADNKTRSTTDNKQFRTMIFKMLLRAKERLKEEEYYAAYVLYNTVHARCYSKGLHDDAIAAVLPAIKQFIACEQRSLASDLGLSMISALMENKIPVTEQILDNMVDACVMFGSRGQEGFSLMNQAIEYTRTFSNGALESLFKRLGDFYWQERNYGIAMQLYIHGESAERLSSNLITMSITSGYPVEADLMITNCVLQLLSCGRWQVAVETLDCYVRSHPQLSGLQTPLPLINFLSFLIRAIYAGDAAFYETLISLYRPSIARDITFFQHLDTIGKSYFNNAIVVPKLSSEDASYFDERLTGEGDCNKEE